MRIGAKTCSVNVSLFFLRTNRHQRHNLSFDSKTNIITPTQNSFHQINSLTPFGKHRILRKSYYCKQRLDSKSLVNANLLTSGVCQKIRLKSVCLITPTPSPSPSPSPSSSSSPSPSPSHFHVLFITNTQTANSLPFSNKIRAIHSHLRALVQ